MPNRTQLVYQDNPGAVPAEYVVPPSLDLVLQSVVVKWDGSGAAGAFLPVLEVRSQDGKLMGRFHPGTQVAAGDTATVTYAPFLRAGSSAAADTFAHFKATAFQNGGIATVSGVVKNLTGNTSASGPGIAFSTTFSPTRISIATDGNWFYTATLRVQWPAFAGDRYIEITSATPATDFDALPVPVRTRSAVTPDGDEQTVSVNLIPTVTGTFLPIQCNAFQASGVGKTITQFDLTVIAHAFQSYVF